MTGEIWPPESFLGLLPGPLRNELLRMGQARTFQAEDTLILQGSRESVLYVLIRGRVNVIAGAENGTEALLAIRRAGDLLGEMSVFGSMPRTATVIARVETAVLAVAGDDFRKFAHRHTEVMMALAAMASRRLQQANVYRSDAAAYEVEIRVARALLYQAAQAAFRDGGHWTVDLRQSELAMLIFAKEGTVQKAMKGMKHLCASRRGKIIIFDVRGLAELAGASPPARLADH